MTAKSYRAVLERVEEIAPGTRALFLRLPPGHGLQFQPGQFLSLGLPVGEKPVVRAYSLASHPEETELLEICLDRVPGGPGSSYLFDVGPGEAIDFTGPWGTFVLGGSAPESCVLIGVGTGVVPFRPMVRQALASTQLRTLHLVHAASEAALIYRRDFERFSQADSRFIFEPFVDDAVDPSHAPLLSLVRRRYVEDEADRSRHFFICGVGDVVNRLRDLLRSAGYERRAVHYEKW